MIVNIPPTMVQNKIKILRNFVKPELVSTISLTDIKNIIDIVRNANTFLKSSEN